MGGEYAVEIAATSTEYVRVTARSEIGGVTVNAAAPPKFAFLPASTTDNPVAGDWKTGEWNAPHARILIGPSAGALTLTPGEYWVWLTWAAGAEVPVYRAGTLTVY
ncbi:hypothetical protein M2164_005942 [Streptomyces sp. SAI-208]|uniref:hypothetical protein n=1 Tax=Streptomyces sp. SAI-208 TaxID=2940550 RepID=UPI002472F978|nr:hypothetical protein [Streptomyces sp. SAI-208]MDH6610307.1 hypothetical protein [Streptomyces sp. SAI-208]